MRYLIFCYFCFFHLFSVEAQLDLVFQESLESNCFPYCQQLNINAAAQIERANWEIYGTFGKRTITSNSNPINICFEEGDSLLSLSVKFTIFDSIYTDSVTLEMIPSDIPPFVKQTNCRSTYSTRVNANNETVLNNFSVCQGDTVLYEAFEFNLTFINGEVLAHTDNTYLVAWSHAGLGKILADNPNDFCSYADVYVDVRPKPKVDFEMNNSQTDTLYVCQNQNIVLTNTSSNTTRANWDFGDGNFATTFHTTHQYDKAGTYIIQLTSFEGACLNCTDKINKVIIVSSEKSPEIECVGTVCSGTVQKYTVNAANCSNYIWEVSENAKIVRGGAKDEEFIEVIWQEGPVGIISVLTSQCEDKACRLATEVEVPIISEESRIQGDRKVCDGQIATYSIPNYNGTNIQWSVSEQGMILEGNETAAISVLWESEEPLENQWIKVNYEHCYLGCKAMDSFQVKVLPKISLLGNEQNCQGQDYFIQTRVGADSVPALWEVYNESNERIWKTISPSVNFSIVMDFPAGNYTFRAIADSNLYCDAVVEKTIYLGSKPQSPSAIVADSIFCLSEKHFFSIESDHGYATRWFIRDGGQFTSRFGNISSYTFRSENGPYTISAAHYDGVFRQCFSDGIFLNLYNFTSLPLQGPKEVCLYDTTSYQLAENPKSEYKWGLSNPAAGQILQNKNEAVRIFWSQADTHQLYVVSCEDTVYYDIIVKNKPSFNIISDRTACDEQKIPNRLDKTFNKVWWEDIANNTEIETNQALLGPGRYKVHVIAENGCQSTKGFRILNKKSPKVYLSSPDDFTLCNNKPELVLNLRPEEKVTWFRYDDSIAQANTDRLEVTEEGSYSALIKRDNGCSIRTNTVNISSCDSLFDSAIGDLTELNSCDSFSENLFDYQQISCNEFIFEATQDLIDSTVSFLIQGEDNAYQQYSGNKIKHKFLLPGYYSVFVLGKLKGISSDCHDVQQSKVYVPLVADFFHLVSCKDQSIEFTNATSSLNSLEVTDLLWEIVDSSNGDYFSTRADSFNYNYDKVEDVWVNLTVTASNGCTSEKSLTLHSLLNLIEISSPGIACEDQGISFSVFEEFNEVSWDFGTDFKQTFSGAHHPIYNYKDAGNYTVKVSGINFEGCVNYDSVKIQIASNDIQGEIISDHNGTLCEGEKVTLSGPQYARYHWSTSETTPAIVVDLSGQYQLEVWDSVGCRKVLPYHEVSIAQLPSIQILGRKISTNHSNWLPELSLCEGEGAELILRSDSRVEFIWGDELRMNAREVYPSAFDSLTFYARAIDRTTACESPLDSFKIRAFPNPRRPEIDLDGQACASAENALEIVSPQDQVDYLWNTGQVGVKIPALQKALYHVTAVNQYGCMNVSNEAVEVYASPPIDLFPTGCVVECEGAPICFPESALLSSYDLYLNDSLIEQNNEDLYSFFVEKSGSYSAIMHSSQGCQKRTKTLNVEVNEKIANLNIYTYHDINQNQRLDGQDTLVSGIPIVISLVDNEYYFESENGLAVFTDAYGDSIAVSVDSTVINWRPTIPKQMISVRACKDTVDVHLPLKTYCAIEGPQDSLYICPGEIIEYGNQKIDETGTYEIVFNKENCDSIVDLKVLPSPIKYLKVEVWVDRNLDGRIDEEDYELENIPYLVDDSFRTRRFNTSLSDDYQTLSISDTFDVYIDTTIAIITAKYRFSSIIFQKLELNSCDSQVVRFVCFNRCNEFETDSVTICLDSVRYNGKFYADTGTYLIHQKQNDRCDRFIVLTVEKALEIQTQIDTPCTDQDQGSLIFSNYETPFAVTLNGLTYNDDSIPIEAGNYFGVIQSNDCFFEFGFNIEPLESEVFDLPDSIILMTNEERNIIHNYEGNFRWNYTWEPSAMFDCATCDMPRFLGSNRDTVLSGLLMHRSNLGCFQEDSTKILIRDSMAFNEEHIFIPNAFSPNGDGVNDRFKVFSNIPLQDIEFQVYNRGGAKIYEEFAEYIDDFIGWDGSQSELPMTSALYIYVFRAKTLNEKIIEQTGSVFLLR